MTSTWTVAPRRAMRNRLAAKEPPPRAALCRRMIRTPLLLVPALVAACSPRPPWAEGRMVSERAAADPRDQDLSRLEERILAVHNRERAAIGAAPIRWDLKLAADAARYAPVLAAAGKLTHSSPGSRPGEGENLWMGTRRAYELEDMVGNWAAERKLFRPGRFPDVSRSGHWSDVGHYTQMIWPETLRVGCAIRSSARWDVLVCRYAPAGNVVGERVP